MLTTDISKMLLQLRNVRWAPLLLSLALYPVFVALKAWRWNLLVKQLGMQAPKLGDSILLYSIGVFAGAATPGQSGDFIKAWYLRQRRQPLAAALLSVLLDRLFDFLLMAWLSLVGLFAFLHLFPHQLRTPLQLVSFGFAAAMALAIPVLMARRSRDWLLGRALTLVPHRRRAAVEHWRAQLSHLTVRPKLVGSLLLVSVCSATSGMVRLWLLFQALTIAVPVMAFIGSMALVAILQALPISVSGVGIRDAVLITVLGAFGYGPDAALAVSALYLLLNLENILVGFLVSMRFPLGRRGTADPTRVEAIR